MDSNIASIDELMASSCKLYISPISNGLGDFVVSLPIIQTLIEQGVATYLVIRSGVQRGLAEQIDGLKGIVTEEDLFHYEPGPDWLYINLREHPLQKDLWWGSPEYYRRFGDSKINDLLAIICSDFGITVDWEKLVPLAAKINPKFSDSIIFVPGSDGNYKCWQKHYWLSLQKDLTDRGWKVFMLGQPDVSPAVQELLNDIEWIATEHLRDALDIISSASGLISVDTGLMHLSVHQRIPTIALYRQRPVYWRAFPHCFKIEAARPCDQICQKAALSCSNNSNTTFVNFFPQTWQCAINMDENCMASISPEQVMTLFQENEPWFLNNSHFASRQ